MYQPKPRQSTYIADRELSFCSNRELLRPRAHVVVPLLHVLEKGGAVPGGLGLLNGPAKSAHAGEP